jgi:hypothetical protein
VLAIYGINTVQNSFDGELFLYLYNSDRQCWLTNFISLRHEAAYLKCTVNYTTVLLPFILSFLIPYIYSDLLLHGWSLSWKRSLLILTAVFKD